MKILHLVLTLVLGLCVASPLLAGPENQKKKGKKATACPAEKRLAKIAKTLTLTTEQTAKLDALKKEYGPKLADAQKKMQEAKKQLASLNKGLNEKAMEVLTAEQKEQLKSKKAQAKKGEKKGANKKAKANAADGVELPAAKTK